MTRQTEPRQAAMRFCLLALALITCIFTFVALLTYDIADPPSAAAAPTNSPAANWCGLLGAHVAYYLQHYLGLGSYVLVGLLGLAVYAGYRQWTPDHAWLRLVGVVLTAASLQRSDLPAGTASAKPGR